MLETLILWLMCGGGSLDPAYGRSLRFMYASATFEKAARSVDRLRRLVESSHPYYDFKHKLEAEDSLVSVYGRFKPSTEGHTNSRSDLKQRVGTN